MTDTCYADCPAGEGTELDRYVNLGGVPMRDKSGKSGNLIKTIKNVAKKKCATKCENHAECYAFNHRKSNDTDSYPFKCELLKAPDPYDFSYHTPADITVGWRYFRMKSSCASVKKARPKKTADPAEVAIIVPSVVGVFVLIALIVGYLKWLRPKNAKRSSKTHPEEPPSEVSTI